MNPKSAPPDDGSLENAKCSDYIVRDGTVQVKRMGGYGEDWDDSGLGVMMEYRGCHC